MTLDVNPEKIQRQIREAGIAGAGGAGFPAYGKWGPTRLMVNHQESEPGYFMDKWIGREHAEDLAELFDALLDAGVLDQIVISAKEKDRQWSEDLEAATDAKVFLADDLPILDLEDQPDIIFAYTDDSYNFGKEKALLAITTGDAIGDDLPKDHNWVVHNTESLLNLHKTLRDGTPVTRKYVHVYGDTPEHRFLEVPVGTPIEPLLEAAGTSLEEVRAEDKVLADGGPGWCFEIHDVDDFGVRKRTNAILVLDRETCEDVRTGGPDSRINVYQKSDYTWDRDDWETEPTETLDPDLVKVPLISNPGFAGLINPSTPLVDEGDDVAFEQKIADVTEDGGPFSEVQHASIDGTVTAIEQGEEDGFIQIEK